MAEDESTYLGIDDQNIIWNDGAPTIIIEPPEFQTDFWEIYFPTNRANNYEIWFINFYNSFVGKIDPNFITDSSNDINFDEFNTKDFNDFFKGYDFDKKVNINSSYNGEDTEFKTKNATLIVEINK